MVTVLVLLRGGYEIYLGHAAWLLPYMPIVYMCCVVVWLATDLLSTISSVFLVVKDVAIVVLGITMLGHVAVVWIPVALDALGVPPVAGIAKVVDVSSGVGSAQAIHPHCVDSVSTMSALASLQAASRTCSWLRPMTGEAFSEFAHRRGAVVATKSPCAAEREIGAHIAKAMQSFAAAPEFMCAGLRKVVDEDPKYKNNLIALGIWR
jgi:hypothetical protein